MDKGCCYRKVWLKMVLSRIGDILFSISGAGFLYHGRQKKRNWSRLKECAPGLNLKYIRSDYIDYFGKIKGEYRRVSIELNIQESGPWGVWLIASLKNECPLEIDSQKPVVHPPQGWCDIKSDHKQFHKLFQTARMKKGGIGEEQLEKVIREITRIRVCYLKEVDFIKINGKEIRFTFALPALGTSTYITPELFQRALDEIVVLAETCL